MILVTSYQKAEEVLSAHLCVLRSLGQTREAFQKRYDAHGLPAEVTEMLYDATDHMPKVRPGVRDAGAELRYQAWRTETIAAVAEVLAK